MRGKVRVRVAEWVAVPHFDGNNMACESVSARQGRAAALTEVLRRVYPDVHCELEHRTALELLVATILSAQCTDKMVNRVTTTLFQKYRTAADYAQSPPGVLEADIQSLGFFRNKARSIRAACQRLISEHGGEVPSTMEALTELAGVGRKTANVVLGTAFGIQAGIVVDTHVRRLAGRLRLTREVDPEKIERDLTALVPAQDWTLFSHWLIWHGRRCCRARRPDCGACPIRSHCPSATVWSEAGEGGQKEREAGGKSRRRGQAAAVRSTLRRRVL